MIRGFSAVSVIVLLFFISGFSQQQSPPNPLDGKYFRSPVDFPFRLSGNFCELRETHFHSGIDIKPSGHKGNPIYSIADGYVSRIKISAGGYGIAVYVDHPETGYTSVYAHLENLNEHFDFVVRQIQIAQESYEVDFCLLQMSFQ
ncbi:MAG: M23 family metallopeptidase [Saprospiraceae bacterium]|nr:M23 family metallopeptidase [Saprospiraceae bacterium]